MTKPLKYWETRTYISVGLVTVLIAIALLQFPEQITFQVTVFIHNKNEDVFIIHMLYPIQLYKLRHRHFIYELVRLIFITFGIVP